MNTESLKPIVTQYFKDNPQDKDHVMKAFYAFHAPHHRVNQKGHNFAGGFRSSICHWCKRSREEVRYDDLPEECLNRPEFREIEDVIKEEENHAHKLFQKAQKTIEKVLGQKQITGEILAILHHTHGYDPETVAGIIYVPNEILKQYYALMEIEKERSRLAQKKVIIEISHKDSQH